MRKTKILNWTCIILAFSEVTFVMSILVSYLVHASTKKYDLVVHMTSWVYLTLGVILLITGITMICVLRINFKVYYNEFKCILWTAAIGMAIPMFFRSVINWLLLKNAGFSLWYLNHLSYTNTMFVLVTTFIPILAQMGSLIFGFTRRSRDKKISQAFA
jgi:cytochrome b subunit of formate dehydrogenase